MYIPDVKKCADEVLSNAERNMFVHFVIGAYLCRSIYSVRVATSSSRRTENLKGFLISHCMKNRQEN